MKLLNGSELAGFIKERQARTVRGLGQANGVVPRLAIIQVVDDPVINTYVRLKKAYGKDIGVEVDIHRILQAKATTLLSALNSEPTVHGIIVQLPLEDTSETDELCDLVAAEKDVDRKSVV